LSKAIKLSEGEWKLMKLLWEESPQTLSRLVSAMKAETGWTKGTVFMMLSRLGEKGAVRFEDNGRSKLYYPVFLQGDAAFLETESFLSRVYGGSLSLMVASMAGQKGLKPEEIDELYAILREAEEKGKP